LPHSSYGPDVDEDSGDFTCSSTLGDSNADYTDGAVYTDTFSVHKGNVATNLRGDGKFYTSFLFRSSWKTI